MNEPSGRRWREPFARFDPDTSSWKTWQPSLPLENLPELPVTWPRSGTWDLGAAYALPTSALPTGVRGPSSLLPTPNAADGMGGSGNSGRAGGLNLRTAASLLPTPNASDWKGPNRSGSDAQSALLPTPSASNPQDGEAFATWEARRKIAAKKHNNGNGIGMPLTIAVQLLPTPTSRDHKGPNQRNDQTCLTGALLPTPRATDGTKGGPSQRGSSGDLMLPSVVQLLPTPRATRGGSATETVYLLPTPSVADATGGHRSRSGDRSSELLLPGVAQSIGVFTPSPSNDGNDS